MNSTTDLSRYFASIAEGAYAGLERFGIHLLDQAQSRALTEALSYHPYLQEFGGVVLDDPGTSQHHVYLTQAPLAGSVLFLSHDDDSRVVFPSLAAFVEAVQAAQASDAWLPDLHPPRSPAAADQAQLRRHIEALLDSAQDATELVLVLIPSLHLDDAAWLERLAGHEDFFVAEALALAIEQQPAPGLRPLAERCARHAHPQAAQAGRRALSAIRQAIHEGRAG